jgi:PhnB protein
MRPTRRLAWLRRAPTTKRRARACAFTAVPASDGRCLAQPDLRGFSPSLTVPDETEAEPAFAALAGGGRIRTPWDRTFFAPRPGVVSDRFGVSGMVIVAA